MSNITSELTDKEKEEIMQQAFESIATICTLNKVKWNELPKNVQKTLIMVYQAGTSNIVDYALKLERKDL